MNMTDIDSNASMPEAFTQIEQDAAHWFITMNNIDVSPEEKADFVRWLKTNTHHQSEYFRLRKIWQALPNALSVALPHKLLETLPETLTAVSADNLPDKSELTVSALTLPLEDPLTSLPNQTPEKSPGKSVKSNLIAKLTLQKVCSYAAAACVCLALILNEPWLPPVLPIHYATQAGESRLLTLTDGSTIKLNTQSKIIVDYSDETRLINLIKGEAYFVVAKDKPKTNRPFVVKHKNYQFTALGTEFSLRATNAIQLVVTEHSVAVANHTDKSITVEQSSGLSIVDTWQPLTKVEIEQLLAWRKQQLIFTQKPLKEVLAELERYTQGQIHLSNTSMANEPVTGIFNLQQPEEVLQVIAEVLELTVYKSKNNDFFIG
jgi:transmembrane sensor